MQTAQETLSFQAEVKELLGLMIHSLYSKREIFLRELISNASDALDKLRHEALTQTGLWEQDERLHVRIESEAKGRVLRVRDNGIGMNREELVGNLGTIASSGTRRFLEALRAKGGGAQPELIGQFGVGFYSSFMVSAEVVVETRRAGEATGWRWSSKGDGTYTLEPAEGLPRGTAVALHLKPAGEDEPDWIEPDVIAGLVRRYSDFVAYPIEMAAAYFKERGDLPRSTAPDGLEVVTLNSMRPLWSRPKEEIRPDEYAEFYRHLTHEPGEPLETIHFKAEGAAEYTALLFVPAERPLDLFGPGSRKSHMSLYVRRVFVAAECEELLPAWLRFVRGLVDSADLPLNVSREVLQKNRAVEQIRKRLATKTLDALGAMLKDRRADYVRFWRAFGSVLKEGIVLEPAQAQAIAALCLFESSRAEGPTTLDEYLARRPADQKEIHVLAGSSRETLLASPHLEALAAHGREVLFLLDPVDEWVVERMRTYADAPLRPIDRGELDLGDPARKSALEASEREARGLLESLETRLSGAVSRARLSSRLTSSPAVLVEDEHALGRQMERLLRESGQEPPPRKRILELNPEHPVVRRMGELHARDPKDQRLADFSDLLLGQALLAEGSSLPDPARFSRLVADLMLATPL